MYLILGNVEAWKERKMGREKPSFQEKKLGFGEGRFKEVPCPGHGPALNSSEILSDKREGFQFGWRWAQGTV